MIRFFRFRGCADPLRLADETVNRVALKVADFDSPESVKVITYFYGFAANIYMEYLRETEKREVSLDSENLPALKNLRTAEVLPNVEGDCLEKCLLKLLPEESSLVIEYYEKDKSEKFEVRRRLATTLNLKMPALHTKVFRLRNILRECIEKCVTKNSL